MKTLVWVEHEGGALKDATLSAVTAAAKLGEVHLLVAGEGVGGVAEAAAKIAGVGKVHVADNAAYAHALPEAVAPLIVELMGHHDAFVAPATSTATRARRAAPRSPSRTASSSASSTRSSPRSAATTSWWPCAPTTAAPRCPSCRAASASWMPTCATC